MPVVMAAAKCAACEPASRGSSRWAQAQWHSGVAKWAATPIPIHAGPCRSSGTVIFGQLADPTLILASTASGTNMKPEGRTQAH
jgi:hypothetical protein